MALVFADSFGHYNTAQAGRKWDRFEGATIGNYGRRAARGVLFNQGALVRNIGNQDGVVAGIAVFPSSSTFFPPTMSSPGAIANTQTSKGYLLGFGLQGVAQGGLMFTNDGALHVVAGGAFDLSAFGGGVLLQASSAAGVLSFTGWNYVEIKADIRASSAHVIVRVNGVEKINETGLTMVHPSGVMANYASQLYIGGGSFGALSGQGWSGRVADLYLFNKDGAKNDDFVGDVAVIYRKPEAAGDSADSTIVGTSPAPTRYQSVDDDIADDDVTGVELVDDGDQDLYEHEDLPFTEAEVFAVQGILAAKKSDAGIAAVRHIQKLDGVIADGVEQYPAGGEFRYLMTAMDGSADGAWTLEKFNATQFGPARGAP